MVHITILGGEPSSQLSIHRQFVEGPESPDADWVCLRRLAQIRQVDPIQRLKDLVYLPIKNRRRGRPWHVIGLQDFVSAVPVQVLASLVGELQNYRLFASPGMLVYVGKVVAALYVDPAWLSKDSGRGSSLTFVGRKTWMTIHLQQPAS